MKYTITINLSLEDLAALADCAYNPASFWRRGILHRTYAKPRPIDVRDFVKAAAKEKLRGAYIASGAARRDYLEAWKSTKRGKV